MNPLIKKLAMKLSEKELVILAKKDPKYKEVLLERHFEAACKWARKYMDGILYADIPRLTEEEIKSMVYIAFDRAVEKFDPYKDNPLSFKNYFYLMIKYQGYSEIKIATGNWLVKNYDDVVNDNKKEESRNENYIKNQLYRLECTFMSDDIIEFLTSKNDEYADIILLKAEGLRNKDICKVLNISPMSLKAKIQYIRKLVRDEFSNFSEIF